MTFPYRFVKTNTDLIINLYTNLNCRNLINETVMYLECERKYDVYQCCNNKIYELYNTISYHFDKCYNLSNYNNTTISFSCNKQNEKTFYYTLHTIIFMLLIICIIIGCGEYTKSKNVKKYKKLKYNSYLFENKIFETKNNNYGTNLSI